MSTWPDLYASRWDWSVNTLVWLRDEIPDLTSHRRDHEVAHVMVIGDSQAGKTTLLIRLMGVTGDWAIREAETVLRAGRVKGNSSTALPIRYRWSDEPDRWLLVRGSAASATSHSSEEMVGILAGYRSPDGGRLRWQLGDRPLEIGLPTRLSGKHARHDLRVLDVPGLFAASPDEQDSAQAIVSHFAPTMTVRIFVQPANKMADAFNDTAILDNIHLAGWAEGTRGFRIVLTHAFSDHTVRTRLHDRLLGPNPASSDAKAVVEFVRGELAGELARSVTGVDEQLLANMLYPVDVGESAAHLAGEDVGDRLEAANERALQDLRGSIEADSTEDGYHLAVPDYALRVLERTRRQAHDRDAAIDEIRAELATAGDQLTADKGRLDAAGLARDDTSRRRANLAKAVERLRRMPVPYRRPAEPAMTGGDVRASQGDERAAWRDAAAEMWRDWRTATLRKVGSIRIAESIPVSDVELVETYVETVACCGRCTERRWRGMWRDRPEHCYALMTAAEEPMTSWIRAGLISAAEIPLRAVDKGLAELEDRHAAARRVCEGSRAEVRALKGRLDALAVADADAKRREARDLENAGRIMHELNRNNERHVRELLARLESAADDGERGWLAIAILRSLHDLERMRSR